MTELECQSNQTPAIKSQKTELNQTIEELENALRDKEEVRLCRWFWERVGDLWMFMQQSPPSMLHCLTLAVYVFQEMEKLKEELENMNDLMEQKDTLTQKLEVCVKL